MSYDVWHTMLLSIDTQARVVVAMLDGAEVLHEVYEVNANADPGDIGLGLRTQFFAPTTPFDVRYDDVVVRIR